jgi:hypothetical protein
MIRKSGYRFFRKDHAQLKKPAGVTRPILSQSSDSTSRLGRNTEGNDAQSRSGAVCETARKHRTRPTFRSHPECVPRWARFLVLYRKWGRMSSQRLRNNDTIGDVNIWWFPPLTRKLGASREHDNPSCQLCPRGRILFPTGNGRSVFS